MNAYRQQQEAPRRAYAELGLAVVIIGSSLVLGLCCGVLLGWWIWS